MVKRRSVLKGIGVSIGLMGVGGVGSARERTDTDGSGPPGTAGVANEERLPIHAEGKLIHKITPNPDSEGEYRYERTFKSPDLAERYGDPTFTYETISVPKEQVREEVRNGKKSTYVQRTQQVIGTAQEQRNAEREIWNKKTEGGVQPQHIPSLDGNVPLYHYKKESDAEDMQNRGAPLNVAWETEDSQSIKNHMENGNGGGRWLPASPITAIIRQNRYVNLPDGGTKSNDTHVMRWVPNALCTTKQYHIRLYDVPFDDIKAVGQAHRDPCDHGKIPLLDANFKLDKAREAVVGFWGDGHPNINHESTDIGNTSNKFGSHSGTWAYFDED
ncbi:hypothetical protein [Halogeometricum borinquense]|nr:hypothetical protein [Halogeometricum borinquense]